MLQKKKYISFIQCIRSIDYDFNEYSKPDLHSRVNSRRFHFGPLHGESYPGLVEWGFRVELSVDQSIFRLWKSTRLHKNRKNSLKQASLLFAEADKSYKVAHYLSMGLKHS